MCIFLCLVLNHFSWFKITEIGDTYILINNQICLSIRTRMMTILVKTEKVKKC